MKPVIGIARHAVEHLFGVGNRQDLAIVHFGLGMEPENLWQVRL